MRKEGHMGKSAFCVRLAVFVALTLAAVTRGDASEWLDAKVGDIVWSYTLQDGRATIESARIDYDVLPKLNGLLEIPAALDGHPVRAVGEYPFGVGSTSETITTVIIPEGVEEIGEDAFPGFSKLTSVSLPSTLRKIGRGAFSRCFRLETAEFPDSMEDLGQSSFSECSALKLAKLPAKLRSIGESAFSSCVNLMENLVIPEGVTNVGDSAFARCSGLKSVRMPSSLETLGSYAFAQCTGLNSVKIPPSVVTVGTGAFRLCGLVSLEIPVGVDGHDCFEGSEGTLTSLTLLPGGSEICDNCFRGFSALTAVAIPDGVERIGVCAFYDCTSLKSVKVPQSVTKLGSMAFSKCPNLSCTRTADGFKIVGDLLAEGPGEPVESLTMPASVRVIADGLFADYNLDNLTTLKVDSKNKNFCVVDGVLYDIKKTRLLCAARNLTSVTIPDSVVEIDEGAFKSCGELTSVRLPSALKAISGDMFAYCSGLKAIEVPSGVTIIGGGAFNGCRALEAVSLPEGLRTIGSAAFQDCPKLSDISIPASVESIEYRAFDGCRALGEGVVTRDEWVLAVNGTCPAKYVLPEGVRAIAARALDGSRTLEELVMPADMKCLESAYIDDCPALRSVTVPATFKMSKVFSYGICGAITNVIISAGCVDVCDGAFQSFSGLTSVSIPEGVTNIGVSAFSDTKLKSVKLPSTLRSLGDSAFYRSALEEVSIPEGVEELLSSTFGYCGALKSVRLPSTLKRCDTYAFVSCTGVRSVTFSPEFLLKDLFRETYSKLEDVTILPGSGRVAEKAFYDCWAVEKIVVPEGVTNIEASAFNWCRGLKEVSLPAGLKAIGKDAFYECKSLESVVIPESVTSIGEDAFKGCVALGEVVFPERPVALGAGAFADCPLKSIQIPGDMGLRELMGSTYGGVTNVIVRGTVGLRERAFEKHTSLKSVTLAEGLTEIGAGAFEGCTGLASIDIPSSVRRIGSRAFYGCYGLKSIVLREGLEDIGDQAFVCGLTAPPSIPASVTHIGVNGISCYKASEVVVSDGCILSVGSDVRAYEIPANIRLIADNAFAGRNVMLSGGSDRYRIVDGILYDSSRDGLLHCSPSVTEAVVPSWVKRIGGGAFSACTSLSRLTFDGDRPETGGDIFGKASPDVEIFCGREASGWRVGEKWQGCSVYHGGWRITQVRTGTSIVERTWDVDEELNENLTLESGFVYVVDGSLRITSGVTMRIEAGAIVKFVQGSRLIVETGGHCLGHGAVFTCLGDDDAGGDTLGDGDAESPVANAYAIVGLVERDEKTEFRYLELAKFPKSVTGSVVLPGFGVYCVDSDATVSSGATLTLLPGTIVKFASGCTLKVEGTLDVQGSRLAPVVFTSAKDDAWGGDTNGDGDETSAQPGDWRQILVSGSARFDYCRVMHCSSRENYGGLEAYGGAISFDNSMIAHTQYECVNAHGIGSFIARNSVFWDSSLGFGYYGSDKVKAYNCVFADLTAGIRQREKILANCIFYRCAAFTDQGGDGSRFTNCVFFNPRGFGPQDCSQLAYGGNTWGDPLFFDPENGDFRIAADSPCVDAGDGTVSPKLDYYGQPRMGVLDRRHAPGVADASGNIPDIGIYEVPGTTSEPGADLAVLSVVGVASCRPGDEISVSYVVTNRGTVRAAGEIRDRILLKGADETSGGREVTVKEVVTTYDLAAGEATSFRLIVACPAVRSGLWRFGVTVNAERDIFEQNFSRNTGWAETATDVTLQQLQKGESSLCLMMGQVVGYALPSGCRSVRIRPDGAADLSALLISGANGSVPVSGASGTPAVELSDGTWLLTLSDSDEEGAIRIENAGNASVDLSVVVAETGLELLDVTPSRVPAANDVSVTLTGTGLAEAGRMTLAGREAKSVAFLNAVQAVATFDLLGVAGGQAEVAVDGAAEGCRSLPIEVYKMTKGAKLTASLECPGSSRDGRICTAYVNYANEGDEPMQMPVFKVESLKSGACIGLESGCAPTAKKVFVGGISPRHPAGVLAPGDSGRIPVFFIPFGSYELILSQVEGAHLAGMSAVATRLNLRGRTVYDVRAFVEQMQAEADGRIPCAAVCGRLLDSLTGEPLAKAVVSLVATDGSGVAATVESDASGIFQLTGVADGTYRWALADGNVPLGVSPVTVADRADVNGIELSVRTGGRISGHVCGADGPAVGYGSVSVRNAAGIIVRTVDSDGFGAYVISGLEDGVYSVEASPHAGYCGAVVENVEISAVSRAASVEFELKKGGTLCGTVTTAEGDPVAGGTVQAVWATGERMETVCLPDGTYSFDGLPAGAYVVRYYTAERLSDDVAVTLVEGTEVTRDLLAKVRPIFYATHRHGFGSVTTRFVLSDQTRAEGASAFAWDFDSDGTVDSTEMSPTKEFASVGVYTVTLKLTEGGVQTTSVFPACVTVESDVETVYQPKAIVIGGEKGGSLSVVAADEKTLTVTGTAGIALEPGVAIMGQANGEWFVRKVVSVAASGAGTVLTTTDGDIGDIYVSYAYASGQDYDVSGFSMKDGPVRALKAASPKNSLKATDDSSAKLYFEGNVRLNAKCRPSFVAPDYSVKVEGGRITYMRFVETLNVDLGMDLDFSGEAGIRVSDKKEVPLPPIPLPAGLSVDCKLGFGVEFQASGEGRGTLGGGAVLSFTTGFERIGEQVVWMPPLGVKPYANLKLDVDDLSAQGKVFAQFESKIKFLKLMSVGDTLEGALVAKLSDGAGKTPPKASLDFNVDAQLELNLVDLETPFFDVKVGLIDPQKCELYKQEIANWTGAMPDFSCTPQEGEAPLTVKFTDRSKGDIVKIGGVTQEYAPSAYKWDLAVTKSEEPAPIATYTETDKSYPVSLKVYGRYLTGGRLEKRTYVTVGRPEDIPDAGDGRIFGSGSGRTSVSWDPNEMVGPLGTGNPETQRFVRPGEWMTYTVYFENKAEAAAAAQEVRVTNPLSEWLDWSTFEMDEVAFNNQIDLGLVGEKDGTSEVTMNGTGYSVRTVLKLDEKTGVADWYLRIVDPTTETGWPEDVFAGFLPPNDETFRGEGHLTYRVKVREDAPANARIENSASIVFDYNEPIETDPAWWNTVYAGGEAAFDVEELKVDEGGTLKVVVNGGSVDAASSVQLFVQYNTAAAADLDLKNATVDGAKPSSKGLAFPVTLKWEKGEIGERTVEIPVKKDSAVENDEFLTLQLSKPSGLELGEVRVCTVRIHDPAYDALKAKVEGGTATKKEKDAWTKLQKAQLPYVRSLAEPAHMGKVSGYGKFAAGKKVTLKATAGKGYAFAGWYLGGELVTKSASYSFKATGEDADYRARFVTVAEDKASIRATVNGMELPSTSGQETASPLATNALCGVALFWPLSHEALSATSVKVTGLPKGLKYDTKKKAVTGVPTVPNKTSSVKVAVTTAGKQKATFVLKVTVDPLPEWARGQFTGTVVVSPSRSGEDTASPLTMTVGSTGKVSGKFKDGITNWTFSVSSFATNSVTVGMTNLFCLATAKGTYKVKGKTKKAQDTRFSFWLISDAYASPIAAYGSGNFGDGGGLYNNVILWRVAGVRISVGEAGGGTVKMDKSYGQVAANKTVKLTAKVKKGYAFLGWYDLATGGDEPVSQATTYSLVSDGATDRFLEARFIPESALTEADVALDWNAPTEICLGVSYSAKPTVRGRAAVKIASVSGLPKGLAWKSGKVSGVPTVAKSYTVTVKVALTTNSKKSWTFKVPIEVRALPGWVAGTFEGNLGTEDEPVPVTVTIGSTGKVSGKYTLDGATWTFSAKSFSSAEHDELTHEPHSFEANVTASATINKKKKSQKLVVTVAEEGVDIQAP